MLCPRPDIAALRVRARAAMVNWSPSRRLTSLTGETLEQADLGFRVWCF